jgi:hypothetical protein
LEELFFVVPFEKIGVWNQARQYYSYPIEDYYKQGYNQKKFNLSKESRY